MIYLLVSMGSIPIYQICHFSLHSLSISTTVNLFLSCYVPNFNYSITFSPISPYLLSVLYARVTKSKKQDMMIWYICWTKIERWLCCHNIMLVLSEYSILCSILFSFLIVEVPTVFAQKRADNSQQTPTLLLSHLHSPFFLMFQPWWYFLSRRGKWNLVSL